MNQSSKQRSDDFPSIPPALTQTSLHFSVKFKNDHCTSEVLLGPELNQRKEHNWKVEFLMYIKYLEDMKFTNLQYVVKFIFTSSYAYRTQSIQKNSCFRMYPSYLREKAVRFFSVLHKATTSIESKPCIKLIACTKTFRECISLFHYYPSYLFPSK